MQLKIAPNDVQSMSQDGDAILRSLQNISLPITDLLVRESLQNSLDAAKPGEKITEVDFHLGTFENEKVSSYFDEITDELNQKYAGRQEFLAVSDKNTVGLTGDYASNDSNVLNKSNFHKLVFGIGKNQEQEGAGGSWGLGKTSYFRIGIGIVIYYTRIRVEEGYEERLIASLIESSKQKERLLPIAERGIAWWGEYAEDKERIFPITNHQTIKEFLSKFSLEPYTSNETGTTIIIPYIQPALDDLASSEEVIIFPWEKNRVEAIKMSIQRWYFPRILNDVYYEYLGNSILKCTVNGELLVPNYNFEPIFNIYQKVYNAALSGKSTEKDIHVQDVKLGRTVLEDKKQAEGRVAFCELGEKELDMLPPNNKLSGLAFLGFRDKSAIENNEMKVMAYSRKPGMVIEFTNNRKWLPYEVKQEERHLLIGFFVPNSHAELKNKDLGYTNLESYLRATENSDHADWTDRAGMSIIDRMQKYTKSAILNYYKEHLDEDKGSVTSGLSRKFGAMFMPPRNFGKSSAVAPNKKSTETDSKRHVRQKSEVTVLNTKPLTSELIEVEFRAFVAAKSTSILYLQVSTQEKKMNTIEWKKGIENLKFPLSIVNATIYKINEQAIESEYSVIHHSKYNFEIEDDGFEGFKIESEDANKTIIEGSLTIQVHSLLYLPILSMRTEE